MFIFRCSPTLRIASDNGARLEGPLCASVSIIFCRAVSGLVNSSLRTLRKISVLCLIGGGFSMDFEEVSDVARSGQEQLLVVLRGKYLNQFFLRRRKNDFVGHHASCNLLQPAGALFLIIRRALASTCPLAAFSVRPTVGARQSSCPVVGQDDCRSTRPAILIDAVHTVVLKAIPHCFIPPLADKSSKQRPQ